jgi:hypothetical protein
MSLVDRAKQIVLKPKDEWAVIGAEEPNVSAILTGYVVPLALIPAVASFIGYGLIGHTIPLTGIVVHSINWGIYYALTSFISALLGVYMFAFIIDALAPTFGSQKSFARAFQLVAYSYTPMWLAGIVNILPILSVLAMIVGLYSFYVLFLGFSHTMQTPRDKIVPYLIVSVIAAIVVYVVIGLILTAVMLPLFGLSRFF